MTPLPVAVRAASGLWLAAVALGALETVIVVAWSSSAPVAGVLFRCVVYAAAIFTTLRMRAGRRWARLALALVLGVVGTLSLVVEPIGWLAGGNSLTATLSSADATWWATAVCRAAHVLAVWAAVPLMFTRAANAYFRPGPPAPAAAAGSSGTGSSGTVSSAAASSSAGSSGAA